MLRLSRLATIGLCLSLCLLAGTALGQTITVIDEHPRLVFRVDGTSGSRTFQNVRDLYSSSSEFSSEITTWLNSSYSTQIDNASRFIVTGQRSYAELSLNTMNASSLSYSGLASDVQTGMHWALAYDWIHNAWDGMTPPPDLASKLANIESKIASFTAGALNNLDYGGQSLWHRKSALAATAWMSALALDPNNPSYDSYRTRAWNHWQDSLRATSVGAWPEGPTYWATSRATHFPLAYMSYESAVSSAPELSVADPVDDLRNLGLWLAYSERGDGSFNRYGDVGSQVNISNGTIGMTLDIYAQATDDPNLRAFAGHARDYRSRLYHNAYGWMYPVGFDPTGTKPAGYDPSNPSDALDSSLPNAMVFGRDSMGFVVMRQGWGDGDTQISFKAGDYLAHHGHNDQGTFTMFKNAPLVINSGGYGPYAGVHRLNYYGRTVSVNSLLIQRPDEQWTPAGSAPPGGYVNDGGQRIQNLTGSNIYSYASWEANKTAGKNYEQADITAFDNVDDDYSYVASDLTRAYNSTLYDSESQGGKVSNVTRQMVYLQGADAVIIFDRVTSVNPTYKKKWLLHTPNKFVGGTESVAVGTSTNGIIEVDGSTIADNVMTMTNGGGKLFLQVVSPSSYTVNKVGGTNYRYYVEDDGDDSNGYDGSNHDDYSEQSWHDYGDWRIEISPSSIGFTDTFLNVLTPRDSSATSVDLAVLIRNDSLANVILLGQDVVTFGTTGMLQAPVDYALPQTGIFRHLVVDLPANGFVKVSVDHEGGQGVFGYYANEEGVLRFTTGSQGSALVTVAAMTAPLGDLDLDGDVDGTDLATLALNWDPSGTGANWTDGDFNNDGDVDGSDLAQIGLYWNPAGAPVPEPASMALLAFALAAAAARRRR